MPQLVFETPIRQLKEAEGKDYSNRMEGRVHDVTFHELAETVIPAPVSDL